MTPIQCKIIEKKSDLKQTKNKYAKLIEDLKHTYMERKDFFDEESPLVLKSELNRMRMAYDFLKERAERYDFNSRVRRENKWKSVEPLNYYCTWNKEYDTQFGTMPCYILDKKYIKELPSGVLNPVWKKEVQENKNSSGFFFLA